MDAFYLDQSRLVVEVLPFVSQEENVKSLERAL